MAELSNSFIFILGPTASGKSKLGIMLSEVLPSCELINADSVQIFAGLKIGASSPSEDDFKKVPHHLYNFVPNGGLYTAADYAKKVLELLPQLSKGTPILVGGSGFYVQALERGMFKVPEVPEEILLKIDDIEKKGGNEALHKELKLVDELSAERIEVADSYRLRRALSVSLAANKAWSLLQKEFEESFVDPLKAYKKIKVGLKVDRDRLRERVQLRAFKMLEMGLLEEVKTLVEQTGAHWRPLQSVGYKECLQHLRGNLAESELLPSIVQSTMALAKKQMTWFKRDKEIQWFDADEDLGSARDFVVDAVKTPTNNR